MIEIRSRAGFDEFISTAARPCHFGRDDRLASPIRWRRARNQEPSTEDRMDAASERMRLPWDRNASHTNRSIAPATCCWPPRRQNSKCDTPPIWSISAFAGAKQDRADEDNRAPDNHGLQIRCI